MASIELHRVTKRFGTFTAVDALDLDIREGEFLTLLGPSGCGKTTTLRMLAGLEDPDGGEILFDGQPVFSSSRGVVVPPGRRGIGLIFQSYALWPHMTVERNVAFGLEERGLRREEVTIGVRRALEVVQLAGLGHRYPAELSGGQQQRVALARVIAVQPRILLMDEPLSNLDAKLRIEMRSELKRLHAETGTTTVYVTHDQYEALGMSDRIAVMRNGRLEQLGMPGDIYDAPANLYVANFVGTIPMNLVRGRIQFVADAARLVTSAGWSLGLETDGLVGVEVVLGMRPEHIGVAHEHRDGAVAMTVRSAMSVGSEGILQVTGRGTTLLVRHGNADPFEMGDEVWVRPDPRHMLFFDPTDESLITGQANGGSSGHG